MLNWVGGKLLLEPTGRASMPAVCILVSHCILVEPTYWWMASENKMHEVFLSSKCSHISVY